MKKIKTYLAFTVAIAIAIGATYMIMRWQTDSQMDTVRESYQTQLDSVSVVATSAVRSRGALEDSLETLDEEFSAHVLATGDQIMTYSTIIATLRARRDQLSDSLKEVQTGVFIGDLIAGTDPVQFKDTSFTRIDRWNDSLFETSAQADLSADSMNLTTDLEILRQPRIDVATTVNDDQTRINIFVRSKDFDSLDVRSATEITPEKSRLEKSAPYILGAAVLLAVKEAIEIFR